MAPPKGFRHSEETRRKMSATRTGRKRPETTGVNHPRFAGGRFVDPLGYVRMLVRLLPEGHPYADLATPYVHEHRAVMAASVGRRLTRAEHVHHVNGDRTDNRLENLMLFASMSEHRRHHVNLAKT